MEKIKQVEEYREAWRSFLVRYNQLAEDAEMPEHLRDELTVNLNAEEKRIRQTAEDEFMTAWYRLNAEYLENEKNITTEEYKKNKLIRSRQLAENETTKELEQLENARIQFRDRAIDLQKSTKALEVMFGVVWDWYPKIFFEITKVR